MKLNPYLNFNKQCAAAFKFYQQVLGGEIVMMMTHGDSPMAEHMPKDWQDAIMHARLVIGDNVLMGSDTPPDHQQKPQGFAVALNVDNVAEAERIFAALSENGIVQMPIQQTFWATRFGMLTDQFGTPWMVNCEKNS